MTKEPAKSNLATIEIYNDAVEANFMKGKLEAAGIMCFLTDEYFPLQTSAIGGVKLKVKKEDVERAKEILNEKFDSEGNVDESAEDEKDEQCCPNCGSKDVILASSQSNTLKVAGVLFLNSLPFNKSVRFYCTSCKKMFKRKLS